MMGGGSVEVDGVMQEHYPQPVEASLAEDHTGFSRGGGAALRGTRVYWCEIMPKITIDVDMSYKDYFSTAR